jgi:hypothetical protein
VPNYKETPGEYSRRNTPGSIENLREEMKIAYRNEFDRLTGNETAEELTDMLKNLDTDGVPFAAGGVAGLLEGMDFENWKKGKDEFEKEQSKEELYREYLEQMRRKDIPISEKISLLGGVQYDKFRNKIEKGDKELFLEDPASSINRKIGIGFDSGTGKDL